MKKKTLMTQRKCRECGCTDNNTCVHKRTGIACHWVTVDLCSVCFFPELGPNYFYPSAVPKSNPKEAA